MFQEDETHGEILIGTVPEAGFWAAVIRAGNLSLAEDVKLYPPAERGQRYRNLAPSESMAVQRLRAALERHRTKLGLTEDFAPSALQWICHDVPYVAVWQREGSTECSIAFTTRPDYFGQTPLSEIPTSR